jgi:hypothetical protein
VELSGTAITHFFVFIAFWIMLSRIVSVMGRFIFYGNFAREIIEMESAEVTFKTLWDKASDEIKNKRRFIWYWNSGIARPSKGILISFVLGLVIT